MVTSVAAETKKQTEIKNNMSTYTITPELTAAEAAQAIHDAQVTDATQLAAAAAWRNVPLVVGMRAHCTSDALNRGGVYCALWQGGNPGNKKLGEIVHMRLEQAYGAGACDALIEVTEVDLGKSDGYGWAGKITAIAVQGKMGSTLRETAAGTFVLA